MALTITSPAFSAGEEIPARYTCEGAECSPPLAWHGAPERTASFVLIVDDPDAPDPRAPRRTFVHWVLYNLPPETTGLAEGVDRTALPAGTLEGRNDGRDTSYVSPCPPIGRHRYFFRLYALDAMLPDLRTPLRADVDRAMASHILAQAELMGTVELRQK